jgi:hypothetical protein
VTINDQGLQIGASGINRSGQTGAAAPDDDNFVHLNPSGYLIMPRRVATQIKERHSNMLEVGN